MRQHALVLLGLGLAQGVLSAQSPSVSPREVEQIERSIEARGWADEIWDEISDAATCAACQSVLLLLKGLAALGDDAFVDTIQEICKLSGAEDDDVCDGSIAREGPIIASGIRQMDLDSRTSDEFCITFLGLCEYPDVEAWAIPFPSAKPSSTRPAPSGQDPIKVVHYSDIHIDSLYVPGSSADCTKPICCRPYTVDDEPGNTDSPAGPNGDHSCDVPVSLEESMYAAINQIVPDAAFTIFTGDIVDHAVWNTSQPYNEKEITDAYGLMDKSMGLVYGTAGNHEAHPTNAYQPSSVGNDTQALYELLSGEWSRWIGDATADAETRGAYSAKYPDGNLRVISLNTNLYYRQNYWMYQKEWLQDPNGQLEWLVSELDAAEQAGENVYIIGHMPTGDTNAFHEGSHYLDQVTNRYSATIAAMFFGHTHLDAFQLSYSNYSAQTYSNAQIMSYVGPSLTPTSGMPSFRVYDVDPVTFAILDATTYIADMTNAAFQTTGPVWTKYYSAKKAYGPIVDPPLTDASAELTPAFWHNVTTVLQANSTLFDEYIVRKSRGWKAAPACDDTCRAAEVCQLRAARSENNCYEPTPGVNLSKRSEDRHENRDECGISVSRATIGALAVKRDMLKLVERRFVEGKAKMKI